MQKLISELTRLYLPASPTMPHLLAQHVSGQPAPAIDLVTRDGRTRAMVIGFPKMANGEEVEHWRLLCVVANALQAELGLPAPAVSIAAAGGYGLWLSLEAPVPVARVQSFLDLLRGAYFPGIVPDAGAAARPLALPPCLDQDSGKWAAFIHPALGASFADESGLEMAPPLAGQAALLESLHSISEAQFLHAMDLLAPAHDGAASGAPAADRAAAPAGLLLKDATLEDIVSHLHAKNIEPTFRHLI